MNPCIKVESIFKTMGYLYTGFYLRLLKLEYTLHSTLISCAKTILQNNFKLHIHYYDNYKKWLKELSICHKPIYILNCKLFSIKKSKFEIPKDFTILWSKKSFTFHFFWGI